MNGIILILDLLITYFLQCTIKVKYVKRKLKVGVGREKPTNGNLSETVYNTLRVH